jgi:hypothetical protein
VPRSDWAKDNAGAASVTAPRMIDAKHENLMSRSPQPRRHAAVALRHAEALLLNLQV